MAPIRVRFSPGLLQEQDFWESNIILADHDEKNWFSAELSAPAGF
jgi:hypothetical protein